MADKAPLDRMEVHEQGHDGYSRYYSVRFGVDGLSPEFTELNFSRNVTNKGNIILVNGLGVQRMQDKDGSSKFVFWMNDGNLGTVFQCTEDGRIQGNASMEQLEFASFKLYTLERVIQAGSVLAKPENGEKMAATLATLRTLQGAFNSKATELRDAQAQSTQPSTMSPGTITSGGMAPSKPRAILPN